MTRRANRQGNRAAARTPVWGTRYRIMASIFSFLATIGCYGLLADMGTGSEGVVATIMLACNTLALLGWGAAALADAVAAVHHLSQDESRLVHCMGHPSIVYHDGVKPARWNAIRTRVLRGERGCVSAQIAIALGAFTFLMTNMSYDARLSYNFDGTIFLILMLPVSSLLVLVASVLDQAVRSAAREFKALEERIESLKKHVSDQHKAYSTDKRLTRRNLELQEKVKELKNAHTGQANMILDLRAENERLKAEIEKAKAVPKKEPGTGTAAVAGTGTAAYDSH